MGILRNLVLIFAIGFALIALSMLLTYQSNNDTFEASLFLGWTGFTFAAFSVVYALIATLTEKKERENLSKSIEYLIKTSEEIKKSVKTNIENQKKQNERLDNIEKELKLYQQKLSSTNLLSILINRKKEKDYE